VFLRGQRAHTTHAAQVFLSNSPCLVGVPRRALGRVKRCAQEVVGGEAREGGKQPGKRAKKAYGLPLRAEHGVRSVTEAALSTMIPFGEDSLRDGLNAEVGHDHRERYHQGTGNVLLVSPPSLAGEDAGPMQCRARLGGRRHDDARAAACLL